MAWWSRSKRCELCGERVELTNVRLTKEAVAKILEMAGEAPRPDIHEVELNACSPCIQNDDRLNKGLTRIVESQSRGRR